MKGIIVSTHGSFGRELVKSTEMILGKQENLEVVEFLPGQGPDDLKKSYKSALENLSNCDEILFLVDLFGGSPFNHAADIVYKNDNYELVCGVNMPMLVEAISSIDEDMNTLVENIINVAKESLIRFELEESNDNDEEDEL